MEVCKAAEIGWWVPRKHTCMFFQCLIQLPLNWLANFAHPMSLIVSILLFSTHTFTEPIEDLLFDSFLFLFVVSVLFCFFFCGRSREVG